MELFEHVGGRIRELRNGYGGGKGLSQEELAKQVGVVPNTVSRWETATYRPSLADLEALAKFFGVSILEFFPREEVEADEKIAALLRTAKELKAEDLDELRKYAEFRRARYVLDQARKGRTGNRRGREK